MKDASIFKNELIAPCGMNCALCAGYLALKNDIKKNGVMIPYCNGCRPRDKKCAYLKRGCENIRDKKIMYCYECDIFPCDNLIHLDKRYKKFYKMSMLDNLIFIQEEGLKKFLEKEKQKWICRECGGMLSCHNGICFQCGMDKLRNKKRLYRWSEE
jgi:ribosomal protein L40E